MNETSCIQINLPAVVQNVGWWRRRVGDSRLCAVVKADAYGLGCGPIVQAVAPHVDVFAVFSLQQAQQVLAADSQSCRPVLVFMPTCQMVLDEPLRQAAGQGRLWLSVHSLDCLKKAGELAADLPGPVTVHLFMDTGMSRAGLSADQLPIVCQQAATMAHRVRMGGIYTHFATAESDAACLKAQWDRFVRLAAQLPGDLLCHAANTFATLRSPRYHLDMVRIGLGLYGYAGELLANAPGSVATEGLRPAVSWRSRIVHLGRYTRGAIVGYNGTCTLTRDSLLAVVPVGYGDGYPLALSARGQVGLIGSGGDLLACCPVMGRVNMDQMVIDVTDVPGVQVGQTVELISDQPNRPHALPRLAALADSSCYEMLCRLSSRVPRQWGC